MAGWPSELATWVDEDQVRHLLPSATAYGQVVIQGGGNVMNQGATHTRPVREKGPTFALLGRNGLGSKVGPCNGWLQRYAQL
jgi:hypothetical protein